ncbi:MAG: hypothetical protein V4550_17140 [Gemmatimonadota bacterium]
MLELNSTRWSELSHAFGSAEDVPRLLEALSAYEGHQERAELWYGLSALLCQEGVVSTAAYAAVPHLIAITWGQDALERTAAMHLVVEIETARQRPGSPPIPADLLVDYAATVESLPARVHELAAISWDVPTAQVMAAALLVGKRQPALARAVLDLER